MMTFMCAFCAQLRSVPVDLLMGSGGFTFIGNLALEGFEVFPSTFN